MVSTKLPTDLMHNVCVTRNMMIRPLDITPRTPPSSSFLVRSNFPSTTDGRNHATDPNLLLTLTLSHIQFHLMQVPASPSFSKI
jgi:hypothetical protein